MSGSFRSLLGDRAGAAAAELALVAPLLLVLMCGAFELGNYFLSEHVVQKSVRDAARYAARLPMTDYTGCDVAGGGPAEQQTQRVARFGDPSGSGSARLAGWTADNMTDVSIVCDNSSSYGTGGIYVDFPDGAPVITVHATVPYNTFFGALGIGPGSLDLNAESQAAVIGA